MKETRITKGDVTIVIRQRVFTRRFAVQVQHRGQLLVSGNQKSFLDALIAAAQKLEDYALPQDANMLRALISAVAEGKALEESMRKLP